MRRKHSKCRKGMDHVMHNTLPIYHNIRFLSLVHFSKIRYILVLVRSGNATISFHIFLLSDDDVHIMYMLVSLSILYGTLAHYDQMQTPHPLLRKNGYIYVSEISMPQLWLSIR